MSTPPSAPSDPLRAASARNENARAARLAPIAVLVVAAFALFGDLLVHPTFVLYGDHSDLPALHLPSKIFLSHEWHATGHLPLWSPFEFAGRPFIHDTQVAAFYPPNVAFYLLPESLAGAAMSWLALLHVLVAGLGAHAYGRAHGLRRAGATVTGLGFLFAGKLLTHVFQAGHYNMLPLAWMPLVVLLAERAVVPGGLRAAPWAAVLFALVVLGAFPYVSFYIALFVVAWTLPHALRAAGAGERTRGVVRWALVTFGVFALAAALSAVQLLPSAEAARESTRVLGVSASMQMLKQCVLSVFLMVGAPPTSNLTWDVEGRLGVLWLMAAAVGAFTGDKRARPFAIAALALFAYAAGGAVLFQRLPGFNLFRLPSRALLLLAFPVSVLAGIATDALFDAARADDKRLERARRLGAVLALGVAGLVLAFAASKLRHGGHFGGALYWGPLLLTGAAAIVASDRKVASAWPRAALAVWTLALGVDAWTVLGQGVRVSDPEALLAPSSTVRTLADAETKRPGRVLTRESPPLLASPLWPGLPEALRLPSTNGFNPTDVRRYRELLELVTGSEKPLRALEGPLVQPIIANFPIQNPELLDLLGVRYALRPASGADDLGSDRWSVIARDDAPMAFDHVIGGMQRLPPYELLENARAFPRAFVVTEAIPEPTWGNVLDAIKQVDLRRTVLLDPPPDDDSRVRSPRPGEPAREVRVRDDSSDRVTVEVNAGPAGWLVLADLWFPGWTATVDGEPVAIQRADHAFRAVLLPPGAHAVVFELAPASLKRGAWVSAIALLLVVALGVVTARRRGRAGVSERAGSA
jgi:hypothetical protein